MQVAGTNARNRSRSGRRRGSRSNRALDLVPEPDPEDLVPEPDPEPDWVETSLTFPQTENVRPQWLEVARMWLQDSREAHLGLELWRMRPVVWTGHEKWPAQDLSR